MKKYLHDNDANILLVILQESGRSSDSSSVSHSHTSVESGYRLLESPRRCSSSSGHTAAPQSSPATGAPPVLLAPLPSHRSFDQSPHDQAQPWVS